MKILPINEPKISSFYHVDVPFILLSEDEKEAWLYSHYIQLYSLYDDGDNTECFVDFHFMNGGAFRFHELDCCPWLHTERVLLKTLDHYQVDIQSFIQKSLDDGGYIGLVVDTTHVPNYKDIYYNHNLFIYGYDEEGVYGADHFVKNQLSTDKILWPDLIKATQYPRDTEMNWGHLEGVCVYRKVRRSHLHIYDVDIKKIRDDIRAYITLDDSKAYYRYGINTYEDMIDYLKDCEGRPLTIKPFHMHISHKQLMLERLTYLHKKGLGHLNDIEILESLCHELCIVRNLVMKYNHTRRPEIKARVIQKIMTIQERERQFFENYLMEV